jgi:alkylation response protein AidB-like acyl-CoA dehydrogenase
MGWPDGRLAVDYTINAAVGVPAMTGSATDTRPVNHTLPAWDLLAARVAWSNADLALQIHGGNGYAFAYELSRVLCDARILNIFEGAAEIQANVVGRGLLSRSRVE